MPRTPSTAARSRSSCARRAGPPQPPPRRRPAPGLHLDEAELAAHLALDLAVAARLGQRERLVQHRRALLVTPANGVHERDAERRQRPRQQRRVADAARLRARLPQARDPGSTAPAATAARPASSWPTAAARSPAGGALARLVGRPAHARIGRAPQLAAEQHLAGVGVIARGADLARPRQASHQQLVGAVVEPVQRERPRGQRGAVERSAGRQRSPAPHPAAPPRTRPPSAGAPPAATRRSPPRRRDRPLEQLAAHEPGIGIAGGEREHVDHGARRQPQLQRVPAQRLRRRRARGAAAPASSAAPRADRRRRRRSARPAAPARPAARPGPDTRAPPTPCARAAARRRRRRARSPAVPAGGSRASTPHDANRGEGAELRHRGRRGRRFRPRINSLATSHRYSTSTRHGPPPRPTSSPPYPAAVDVRQPARS